jgi:hypothetical protein
MLVVRMGGGKNRLKIAVFVIKTLATWLVS